MATPSTNTASRSAIAGRVTKHRLARSVGGRSEPIDEKIDEEPDLDRKMSRGRIDGVKGERRRRIVLKDGLEAAIIQSLRRDELRY